MPRCRFSVGEDQFERSNYSSLLGDSLANNHPSIPSNKHDAIDFSSFPNISKGFTDTNPETSSYGLKNSLTKSFLDVFLRACLKKEIKAKFLGEFGKRFNFID